MVQKSLIAFQNDDQDELFNYYDNRQKTRLRKLNKKAAFTLGQSEELKNLSNSVLGVLTNIIEIGKYLKGETVF
eukprot:CAMPEP_0202979890 /NCGR_PEP_ID=MMETSP1396-20130829/85924_1 /ASSEMBLY_ACC=CAM_ASM_000872 /TAXON_ID= /ORGANISM="Pseudokeronopsis sp., Strain Brazil" /LENGTH=73 /DNA_ID=CAMNT_0049719531 /DNA_START=734 /DNA_END=955 /DNA_ORIENTATION=-